MFDWNSQKEPRLILSPMADLTDQPFCRIVKSLSDRPIIFREMVSAEAIVRDNEKTWKMTEVHKDEHPLIQQIFGSDPNTMAKAAHQIFEKQHPEAIDINMGCPVPKMTGSFNGAALMKDPERACNILKAVKAAVPCPVSVKIRTGWIDPQDCLDFAPRLEEAGADQIIIHGRTRQQAYRGEADWDMIRQVKEKLSIPTIANGDIFSADLAMQALKQTNCNGIAIARGALGNPWIFPQIEATLTNQPSTEVTLEDRIAIIRQHLKLHLEHYGEKAIVTFRKHLSWYFKGLPGVKQFRAQLHTVTSPEGLDEILEVMLDNAIIKSES